uniref:F-box domain-containing protein n=1 Tax=Pinguiococcus pyrenoidosus TaxID=172671 RepID=A0A7R9UCB6_9STRA
MCVAPPQPSPCIYQGRRDFRAPAYWEPVAPPAAPGFSPLTDTDEQEEEMDMELFLSSGILNDPDLMACEPDATRPAQPTPASSVDVVVRGHGDSFMLHQILSFLSADEVVRVQLVSRFFRTAASCDFQWHWRCEQLWSSKVYVPAQFQDRAKMRRCAAYWASLRDASRCAIREDELCSLVFHYRMKGWSGDSWTSQDPWWNGGSPGQRRFHRDGTMTSDMGDGRWRILDVPEACNRRGERGSFLRVSKGGVEFPTIVVSRHSNWGWILQNCWSFSASFPLPPRGADLELEDSGPFCQEVTVGNCPVEAMLFNLGIALPGEDRGGGRNQEITPEFIQLMIRYHSGPV